MSGLSAINVTGMPAIFGGISPFAFDLATIAFVPSMAKRPGAVFAGAPIVQGAWDGTGVPDVLTFPRGAQLGNQIQDWYANFDPNQGSIVFWITPEWDGNDGISHYIFGDYFTSPITIFKRFDSILFICHDTDTLVSTNVAAWTAGTTYCVVARWDRKNTLDGTNFGCMTINEVHDFEGTTAWVSVAPQTDIAIGSDGGAAPAGDSIIEGLTVYRRPLWDGAYGKDVGNGDETLAIYAAGAGADPCLVTGSWDVVFCMPTDATPGALVTGTGEAWSHPHGSALPTHAFADDGFGPHQENAILFNGNNTNVNLTSNAVFDDMPDGVNGFQVGCWVRFDLIGADYIAQKYSPGWYIRADLVPGLRMLVSCAGTNASSVAKFADNPQWEIQPDGKWHWVLMSFHHVDQGGDSVIYIQVDGKWATTYDTQDAGIGAYQSDAAQTLYYGRTVQGFEGAGGWLALWNDVTTYPVGTNNIPPRVKPGAGGNLIEAWQCDDLVNAITATVTTPGNDGTLANGTWERKWNVEATPVMPQSVAMTAGDIDFGSGANIDDLPDNTVAGKGPITVEGWWRADGTGAGAALGFFIAKGFGTTRGWSLRFQTTTVVRARIECATTSAIANHTFLVDGVWHHWAMTYDETGDRMLRLWLDGILVSTSGASVGNYDSDAADDLIVGSDSGGIRPFDGAIGWLRISNNVRYTANFTPPDRQNPPANDANAHLLINMDDGAGAQATDTSGNAYHGTITAGRWDNTYDMELGSPGARTFQNGYVLGADGVGDGVGHQFAVTAETDYVVRPVLSPGQDSRGLWNVYIYDVTNAAQIGANYQMPSYHGTHTGGAASPTLDDNTARWPQSLIGAIAYNITQGTNGAITAIDGGMQSLTAGINWNNGDEYRLFWADGYHKHPWVEPFVFRTPVGCVLVDIRLLSLDGEGTLYVHQVEVQESLIDNGWNEAGGGNPWIPTGWANGDLDAGDTQTSSTGGAMIHSGTECIQWNVGAIASEYMSVNALTGAAGDFFMMGGWAYGDGAAANIRLYPLNNARAVLQHSTTDHFLAGPTAALWQQMMGVYREILAVYTPRLQSFGVAAAARYSDDVYLFQLDDVTLTVTPASAANSLESGGIRIDGYDNAPQPIPAGTIRATTGRIRWNWIPRHDAADFVLFGNANPTLLHAWFDATHYIRVYATAANNIRLEFNDGGGVHQANWNCTGLIVADTTYAMEVRYNPAWMQLRVDGTIVATITTPLSFANIPNNAYWGSQQAGDEQSDAVFAAP